MTPNIFQPSPNSPTHISIGAVVINDNGEVLCHYFLNAPQEEGFGNIYLLMRETPEPHEPVEQTIARGMMEEFGATGQITRYLGPIISHFPSPQLGTDVEKTTLYFLVKLLNWDPAKRDPKDSTASSELQWHKPEFLIPKMKEQGQRTGLSNLDESSILERLTHA